MKTILITGVDGSGKSTIFERLKSEIKSDIALLCVPHFDLDILAADQKMLQHAQVLNQMSYDADKNEQSIMKALSLFGSMLLFHRAINLITTPETKILFCERHPLIDARVYASFYAKKLSTASISENQMKNIEEKYKSTFSFLGSLLPDFKGNVVKEIFRVIETYFGKTQADFTETAKLFHVSLPEQIFYLNAPATILYDRISQRKKLEPHETLSTLDLIQNEYSNVLNELPKQVNVSLVDASSFEQLDLFYKQLLTETISL